MLPSRNVSHKEGEGWPCCLSCVGLAPAREGCTIRSQRSPGNLILHHNHICILFAIDHCPMEFLLLVLSWKLACPLFFPLACILWLHYTGICTPLLPTVLFSEGNIWPHAINEQFWCLIQQNHEKGAYNHYRKKWGTLMWVTWKH